MIGKLHHVGIAVRDIEDALASWEALGLGEIERRIVEEFNVVVGMVALGNAEIEYIQPLGEGPVQAYLDERGEGLHHIAFAVEEIEQALADLKARGVRLVDEAPRPGFRGNRVAFLHPKDFHGVLVELVEEA